MRLYNNGRIMKGDNMIGRHYEMIDDLITLTDDHGTYADFPDDQAPRTAVMFADVEKGAWFLIMKLGQFQSREQTEVTFKTIFGDIAGWYLYRRYVNEFHGNVLKFFRCLDSENSKVFVQYVIRL